MSYSKIFNDPFVRELAKADSVIRNILNDTDVINAIRADEMRRREERETLIEYSSYRVSIYYHPNQKNKLGVVDCFWVEGGRNLHYVIGLKMKYNVGIAKIKITRDGKKIKHINLSGNEEKSLSYKPIKLF